MLNNVNDAIVSASCSQRIFPSSSTTRFVHGQAIGNDCPPCSVNKPDLIILSGSFRLTFENSQTPVLNNNPGKTIRSFCFKPSSNRSVRDCPLSAMNNTFERLEVEISFGFAIFLKNKFRPPPCRHAHANEKIAFAMFIHFPSVFKDCACAYIKLYPVFLFLYIG